MSTGLKTITISKGELEYLQSVLNSEVSRDKSTMRKINAAFRCINEPFAAYQAVRKSIRDKYMKPVKQGDQFGNETTKMVIPATEAEAHKKEQDDSTHETVELTFDRETLSFVKTCFDNVFSRQQVAQEGLAGKEQLEYFENISRQLYGAMGLDYDEECNREERSKEQNEGASNEA